MTTSINVAARTETGKLRMKRMRQAGHIPAVLYGAGGDTILLSIPATEFGKVLKTGSKSVELAGSMSGAAEVKDIQWDTFGNQVLHVDFVRV